MALTDQQVADIIVAEANDFYENSMPQVPASVEVVTAPEGGTQVKTSGSVPQKLDQDLLKALAHGVARAIVQARSTM